MAEKSQSNPDPKTATEAKLCAYLEGDIAPADRAEIEKYLESNSAHRQLLTELKKTHGLLASLPRESAPPEIAEAFAGHLERSMLLDETDHEASVRRGRWPQRLAIAAIVFLTFCLGGLVVYIVLPGRPMPGKIAMTGAPASTAVPAAQNATAMPSPAAAVPAKSNVNVTVATADKMQPMVQGGGGVTLVSPPLTAVAPVEDRSKTPGENQPATASQIYLAAHPLEQKMLAPARSLALANDLPADSTVYMIVSTDNPSAAAGDVRNFFQANSFAYTTAANALAGQGAQSESLKIPSNFNGVAGAVQLTPTTQTNFALNQQQQMDTQTVEKDLGDSGQTFVARAMPRTLALELNDTLSTQRPGQTSGVYYLPADVSAAKFGLDAAKLPPSTAPSDAASGGGGIGGGAFGEGVRMAAAATTMPTSQPSQAIAADQPLTVTIDQLVGPGVDKTSNVRVAADGTINLPMIEPVPAAGLTATDLQREIADKYRQANLIHDATVTVTLGLPTTQPIAPATMPTEVESSNGPTTQPADADKVNVVVLVQAAATTQPTTQPATTEPVPQ